MKSFEIELCLMMVSLKAYEIVDSEIQKSLQRIRRYTRPETFSGSLRWWLDNTALTLQLSSALPKCNELFHPILFWH